MTSLADKLCRIEQQSGLTTAEFCLAVERIASRDATLITALERGIFTSGKSNVMKIEKAIL